MGAAGNKLLLPVCGRSILAWTLRAALACRSIEWIGIVGQPQDQGAIEAIVDEALTTARKVARRETVAGRAAVGHPPPVVWILGGDTRQESVRRGLDALPTVAEAVLIHDGARCLATPELLERCADALRRALAAGEAVIAATPVTDTIKQVDSAWRITATPDRSRLWGAQTPQGFPVNMLRQAHGRALAEGWSVTDDAALFERLGLPVRVLEAPPSNIKLTTPFDLIVAEAVLRDRSATTQGVAE